MKIYSLLISLAVTCSLSCSVAWGIDIERTDFKFTAPAGVKAGEESAFESEEEKYVQTNIDLPDGNGAIILAYPDRPAADKEFARWVKQYKTEMFTNAKEAPIKLFDKLGGKGTIVTGTTLGFETYIEVGCFSGKKKAIVFICSSLAEAKEENDKVLLKILDTFKIKE